MLAASRAERVPMEWQHYAVPLAQEVAGPVSTWWQPVASVPRHELVPRWWEPEGTGGWVLRDGPSDPARWMDTTYGRASVVTRVGPHHADHGKPGDRVTGVPTSSATDPALVVRMLRHGRLVDGCRVLDIGTGAGGLTAYASRRLGEDFVTSVDVDPYLVTAARRRLDGMGLRPDVFTLDATGPVPGVYDRIIATVSVRPIPASWISALAPGGRLVTTIARTSLILTATKSPDGGAVGRIEPDQAGFMPTRHGEDYPPELTELFAHAREADGEHVGTGRYPVLDLANAWELQSMYEITTPGVRCEYTRNERRRTALLVHADGSWARATAEWIDPPEVHQGGPRRLWNELERVRNRLNGEGSLPLLGARVRITRSGAIHLFRGKWTAVID